MKVIKKNENEFEIESSEIVKSVLTLNQVNAEIASMEEREVALGKQLMQVQESLDNVKTHKKDMQNTLKEMKKLV